MALLHLAQLPVPAEHPRADAEGVERRQDARQRQQHGDDGEDRRPHPVDQVRQPERQVALQHGHAAGEEALRFLGERPLGVVRVREVAPPLEPAGPAVHPLRRLHEQLDQRRVRAAPGDQRRGRGDEVDVVGAAGPSPGRRRRAAASPR
jgi:hypothetical protein